MRKYLNVLLAVTFLLISGCAMTKPAPVVPPEELTLQEIHEINLSKDAIFTKSLEWMAQAFVYSTQVIELQALTRLGRV